MTEINKRVCKVCKELKDRISDGAFKNGKNKKWRDAEGKLWCGNLCGPCNTNRLKTHMQSKRKEQVKVEDDSI